MTPELAYFLKINVAIALFYAFYRLFFHKDTFFHWRRMALLCFFAISMLYPLLNIQGWIKAHEPMVAMADLYATIILPEQVVTPLQEPVMNWQEFIMQLAKVIYWSGMLLLATRFFVQLGSIIRLHFQCSKSKIQGVRVHLLKKKTGPFSFFHWIFIHPQSHTESEISEIITHEETHARQYHSVDVLISEIMCIFCWFNPFIWLMKREVRGNLEYMADHRVLETGHDSKSYQYHLLGLAHHKAAANLSNSFNVLPLKNRIKMMNKRRTKEIGRTKYLMFLPLAALLMIISNIEAVARTTKEMAKDVIEAVEENLASNSTTPEMEVATEAIPVETPISQQDKDKLVTYKGKVVDKDGKPVEGAEAIRGQNQGEKKGRNRSQESRYSCGGYCKGSVRPCQQFTAERADERSTNSMNITYTQNGDYLIPNIVIRKTKPLGHYGRLRKAYLEMHRPILFNELVLSDKLFEHCAEIDEAARNRMELIVRSLAEQNGVTEKLKAENQMEWVRQMNACKAQAEEIVKAELIYD